MIHDVALMRLPLVVGLDRSGLVGGDGPTHQGLYDIALLQPVPGIVLMAPKDENELQQMVYTASRLDGPAFIRFPKEPGRGVPLDGEFRELPLGQSEVLRSGDRVLILAVGPLAYPALAAAEKLAQEDGIDAAVLNVRFLKPLDRERILALAAASQRVVTVEDGALRGGFAAIVRAELENAGAGCRFLALGVGEGEVPLASRRELLAHFGLDADGIYRSVKEFVQHQ